MMSWVREEQLSWIDRMAIKVLKCGAIPKHVAFIMDGNRRFATKNQVAKIQGHSKGFDKLAETLQWCLDLGIAEVTVYAFSIENFKRSDDEVSGLLDLAREKFAKLLEEKDKLNENGISVRVIGNVTLLPVDLQKLIAQTTEATKNNSRAILNVAFAYTAREEITHSIQEISWGIKHKFILPEDIDEDLINSCLYTKKSPPPDLLIRTSGEVRLSDFLLWQTAYTSIHYTSVLWPEFSLWDLCRAILYYQRSLPTIQKALAARASCKPAEISASKEARILHFQQKLDEKEQQAIQSRLL